MDQGAETRKPAKIPWTKMVFDQGHVTPEIINAPYEGQGTEHDPFIVDWIANDPRDPMKFSSATKWGITQLVAIATLAVAFASSAYSGGVDEIAREFGSSSEVIILGISLFVLGFALGPLLWGPLSELYGRQIIFIVTYALLTGFIAGAAGSQNIQTLLVLRFLAGSSGSSVFTLAGGVITDLFTAAQRGPAMTIFAMAPFLGPTIGPIVGGFVGETIGFRWVEGVMAIFTGVLCIAGSLLIPETYGPVLLRQRARRLSKLSGKNYQSRGDTLQGRMTPSQNVKLAISRPWVLLFREPIVFLLSIYMAIIYGTLYMLFAAYPIVFQDARGWSPGIGGLAFLGVMFGIPFAIVYAAWDNKRYLRVAKNAKSGYAPPEARLPLCMVGGVAVPVGLIWFAWTNSPEVPFIVPIMAGAPFGFGIVLNFLGIAGYLVDSYTIFAASALAANAVMRSIFGAVFPLFTTYMFDGLGLHWAAMVPAFLALACVPFPFLFHKYGARIRVKCKYAKEAAMCLRRMRGEPIDDDSEFGEDGDWDEEKMKRSSDKRVTRLVVMPKQDH